MPESLALLQGMLELPPYRGLATNDEPLTNGGQLRELAARAGKFIALLVQRGNTRLFVPVELG